MMWQIFDKWKIVCNKQANKQLQRRNKQTINDETKEQTAFCTSTCIGIRLGSQKNFETFETFWTFETREPRYFEMK